MSSRPPLHHLSPVWFSIPMGLCGLSLAWQRAVPSMGELAGGFALVIGALALAVFLALAGAALLRLQRHPQAWAEDRAHPVRHAFMAAMSASVILLSTVAVALFAPSPSATPLLHAGVDAAWRVGSVAQVGVTLWTLRRWWGGNQPGGLHWPVLTPALFIPVVGNVLVPLAGVPLGHADWSAAQLGIGVMFWPVVLVLLLARIAVQGLWPERLLPAAFILVAPPAVIGLSVTQFGAPEALVWGLWGAAAFCLLWAGTLAPRIAALPFGLAHWGLSFPLAAFTALTLRLAGPTGLFAVLAPLLLALTSLVIVGLCLATVRGLRQGTLLAPEPVASIQPATAG
jgi:tellurite resistance protein